MCRVIIKEFLTCTVDYWKSLVPTGRVRREGGMKVWEETKREQFQPLWRSPSCSPVSEEGKVAKQPHLPTRDKLQTCSPQIHHGNNVNTKAHNEHLFMNNSSFENAKIFDYKMLPPKVKNTWEQKKPEHEVEEKNQDKCILVRNLKYKIKKKKKKGWKKKEGLLIGLPPQSMIVCSGLPNINLL